MKDKLQNSFLVTAYKEFKLLFAIVAVWAIGTLWFALHSREEFPFLLFGMYSLKEEAKPEYITYTLVVDGKELIYADYRDARRELLVSAVSNNAAGNTLAAERFQLWVKQTTGGKPFEIVQRKYRYNDKGQPVNTHTQIVYPYDIL
ncbi:MAG TPA: hypothetical protein VK174_03460 [Chitinophagales bacterium]|nr:hypothetical protein [Chitinophagales bacterium]